MIKWQLPELEPSQLAEIPRIDLPYAELALDPGTWDILFPPTIIRGADAVLQRIKVRFRFFLGEWFLDQRLGVPYYRDILIKNPDTILITAIFRSVLLSTPGVARVTRFTATLDKASRTLFADFEAYLDDGSRVISQAEPFIIAGSK